MNRIMYDGVDISNIPANAEMVATYINGLYAVPANRFHADFPHATRIYIDVNGTANQAQVRDWETGDKSGSLEEWVANNHNPRPTIYCNRSTIAEVRSLTGKQVLGRDYWLWISTLDGTWSPTYPGAPTGVVAIQYQGGVSSPWDRSIVLDDTWYPSTPVVTPATTPWYGHVTTDNPNWTPATNPATIKVLSHDGGKTWLPSA